MFTSSKPLIIHSIYFAFQHFHQCLLSHLCFNIFITIYFCAFVSTFSSTSTFSTLSSPCTYLFYIFITFCFLCFYIQYQLFDSSSICDCFKWFCFLVCMLGKFKSAFSTCDQFACFHLLRL
jgi:hypothetical protein